MPIAAVGGQGVKQTRHGATNLQTVKESYKTLKSYGVFVPYNRASLLTPPFEDFLWKK